MHLFFVQNVNVILFYNNVVVAGILLIWESMEARMEKRILYIYLFAKHCSKDIYLLTLQQFYMHRLYIDIDRYV